MTLPVVDQCARHCGQPITYAVTYEYSEFDQDRSRAETPITLDRDKGNLC